MEFKYCVLSALAMALITDAAPVNPFKGLNIPAGSTGGSSFGGLRGASASSISSSGTSEPAQNALIKSWSSSNFQRTHSGSRDTILARPPSAPELVSLGQVGTAIKPSVLEVPLLPNTTPSKPSSGGQQKPNIPPPSNGQGSSSSKLSGQASTLSAASSSRQSDKITINGKEYEFTTQNLNDDAQKASDEASSFVKEGYAKGDFSKTKVIIKGQYGSDADSKASHASEVMALQRLRRLVSHQEKPRLVLVQKKIEGESLLSWIQKTSDPQELASKMKMIMKEVNLLHTEAKLSHGDMHPGNMILSPQKNRITFIDFERAKDLSKNILGALHKYKDISNAKDSFLKVIKEKHSPELAKQVERLFKSLS